MDSLRTLLQALKGQPSQASQFSTKPPCPSGEAELCIQSLLRIHGELSQRSELTPCAPVNQLFGELVKVCTKPLSETITKKIIQDQRITEITPSLRVICATAESHLESFWADQIALSEDGRTDFFHTNEYQGKQKLTENTAPKSPKEFEALKVFPYYENYVDLTRLELSALYSIEPSIPRKIAFIGSGPLPLTSLCLCMALDTNDSITETSSVLSPPPSPSPFVSGSSSEPLVILNIDRSKEAISQSQNLCSKLGQTFRAMQFSCEEAGNPESDLSDFDVVYLAALVGMTPGDKEGILIDIVTRMKVGSLLVVRTAHSLRTLLYPEFDATTEAVLACLDIEVMVHPFNHVVNSVIIGRVRAQ